MRPQIVVTGANGFVGRYVVFRLLADGYLVHSVTRSCGITIPGVREHIVASYEESPDIEDAVCIHLAGVNAFPKAEADQIRCVSDALNVAKALLGKKYKKIIFVSSALVYSSDKTYARQEVETPEPGNQYGHLKLHVESLFDLNKHIIARVSNVYGYGMSPLNVISDIISQINNSGPVTMNNINSVRDFIHVCDAANGIVKLALSNESGIYNISTGVGTSITDLVKCIFDIQLLTYRPIVSVKKEGHTCLILNPKKAYEHLGWKSEITLTEGLKLFMEQNNV